MFTRKTILAIVIAVLVFVTQVSFGIVADTNGEKNGISKSDYERLLPEMKEIFPDDSFGQSALSGLLREKPRYKPGEIIVKFKEPAADILEQHLSEGKALGTLKLSLSLDNTNRKYEVTNIEPVVKNFKAKRQRIKGLLTKDKAALTEREKHLVRRLNRAPEGAKVPDLGRIYKIELAPGQSAPQAVAEYNKDPDVEYAELNYILSIMVTEPNDPNYPVQWALKNTGQDYPDYVEPWPWIPNYPPGTADCDIDANEAWDINTGSSNVIVAVIDTGVDYSHRDLQNNMWVNQKELNGDPNVDDDENGYVDDIYGYDFCRYVYRLRDNDPMDDHGHGTHCSGTIAADGNNGLDIAGVCWQAKIMAIKFLSSGGSGYTSDAIEAIEYAVDNGADITSNSWGGGPYSKALENAIDYAYSQGVLSVAAAGNSGSDSPLYPAYYENMIAVAATDSNDQKADFSNYGDWIDIAAPGVDILSLRASGTSMGAPNNDYTTVASGTSMACPHVAGLAALCLAEEPNLTPGDIRLVINLNADDINDPNIGAGRINAYETLNNISNLPDPDKATNPYPADDANSISINTYLSWTADEFASSHDVYLGTDFNDVNDANTSSDQFQGNVFLPQFDPDLDPNNTYYWRIDERNFSGCTKGDVWSFTTRNGTIIYVDADANGTGDCFSWENACTCLEDALSLAVNDEIWVAEGTYKPTDGNDRSATFELVEGVKIYGGFDGTETARNQRDWLEHETILSGDINEPNDANDNCYHVVTGADNIILDGFTITAGNANGYSLVNKLGGGMHNDQTTGMTVANCRFTENSAYGGGGMYNYVVWSAVVTNCTFSENKASTGEHTNNYGGGMCNENFSKVTVNNCVFNANKTSGCGGGIGSSSYNEVIVIGCIFTANEAMLGGGIGHLFGWLDIKNSIFAKNKAIGSGGAVFAAVYNLEASNCTFAENQAGDKGGAIADLIGNCNFTSSILWGNDANASGDQIYYFPNVDLNDVIISYCDIQDSNGSGDDWDPSLGTDGGGNIDADPCFVDTDSNDYHLDPDSSPCINAGDPNGNYTGQTDIDGDPRVMRQRVDIGADEVRRVHNITKDTWYVYIQDALDDANDANDAYDTIEVYPDTYAESVDFNGISCTLTGTDPNDWDVVEDTIIDANGTAVSAVVIDTNSLFTGFTVRYSDSYGVVCNSADPTITRCIIEDNSSQGVYCVVSFSSVVNNNIIRRNGYYGIVVWWYSSPTIKNNWIYENFCGVGTGLNCNPLIRNNTIVDNSDYGIRRLAGTPIISNCIVWGNSDDLQGCNATYSCIEDDDPGRGNTSSDPKFFDPNNNDYHLNLSSSPCINAGDPNGNYDTEVDIDGELRVQAGRIDIGADEARRVHIINGNWYLTIHDAIDDAVDGNEIVVYSGTYEETIDFSGLAVTLRSTDPNDWDVVDATIIDGDGAANVVKFTSSEGANSVLKGLTITGGGKGIYCSGSSPTISNCVITENSGSGMYLSSSSPKVTDCYFTDNSGSTGGGMYNSGSSPNVVNCLFIGNTASSIGGGIFITGSSGMTITNCTLSGNSATAISGYGGGIANVANSSSSVTNCILWDNEADNYSEIYDLWSKLTVTYCDVEGGYTGTGNINSNPLFGNPNSGDYHLTSNSPCIDVGNNNAPAIPNTDIDGDDRIIDGDDDQTATVDMGADEYDPN